MYIGLSVENQKGVSTVQCSVENQKGAMIAITIDFVQRERPSGSQWNIIEYDTALLALYSQYFSTVEPRYKEVGYNKTLL